MLNFVIDQKKSKASAKAGKGSHGSSNAYMLVYNRRDTKSETVSPTSKEDLNEPASVLPAWVRATLDSENQNFDAWNRDIVLRKVRLFTVFRFPKSSGSSQNCFLRKKS